MNGVLGKDSAEKNFVVINLNPVLFCPDKEIGMV